MRIAYLSVCKVYYNLSQRYLLSKGTFHCITFFFSRKSYTVCKYVYSFLFFQKIDSLREGLLIENESQKDASAGSSHVFHDARHKRSSGRWNDEFSPTSSTITEATQAGELISRTKLAAVIHPPSLKMLFF